MSTLSPYCFRRVTKARMDLGATIQQAAVLLRAGRLDEGTALCRQVLDVNPGHPAALHLLALAARERGDLAAAETLFRESLASLPNQPGLLIDFGRLLRAQQRNQEAEELLRRAVAVAPTTVVTWHSLGVLLHAIGKTSEAIACARKAIELDPRHAPGWELLAALEQQRNELERAAAVCREGLRHAPQAGRLHYALAQVLRQDTAFAEAADAYEAARRHGYESPELYQNLGEARYEAGDAEAALQVFTAGTERFPVHAHLHRLRARFHWEARAPGDGLAALRQAARQHVQPELWQVLIDLLNRFDRYDESRAALDEARRMGCAETAELGLLDAILTRRTDAARSGALFTALLEAHPAHAGIQLAAAEHRLSAGDVRGAEALCAAVLDRDPHEQLAWALRGTAWQLLDDPRQHWLLDYERMVLPVRVPAPAGFADTGAFFGAVATALEAQHRSRAHPIEQTVRGGTQTNGYLFRLKAPILRVLETQIRVAIDDVLSRWPSRDGDHPFWGRAGRDFGFSGAWSVRLHSQGYHTNHVHPMGWISSALYVAVPSVVSRGDDGAGCLQFGVPPVEMGIALAPRRVVKPVVGELVLFPSYMWHGTVPFEADEPRITVAFDVTPIHFSAQ